MDSGDRLGDDFPPGNRGCALSRNWGFRARRLATHVRFPNPRLLRAEVLVVSVRNQVSTNLPTLTG